MFLIHSRESLKRVGIRFSQTCGGDKRDRTADPLLAKQVLSQLSYTPVSYTHLDVYKRQSQMEWVQRCNNIHNRAEEIILHERIYS